MHNTFWKHNKYKNTVLQNNAEYIPLMEMANSMKRRNTKNLLSKTGRKEFLCLI